MEESKNKNNHKEEKIISVPKNAAELQKIRLDRLMSNPDKKAHIPDPSKPYKPREPLEFIRNVWGSSAGAGSGDFHVYRGVRRREYARQKFNKEKNEKEEADAAYHQKVEENVKAADERTAKKRAKRQKKKQKLKNKKPKKEEEKAEESSEEDDSESEGSTKNISNGSADNIRESSNFVSSEENNVKKEKDSNNEENENNYDSSSFQENSLNDNHRMAGGNSMNDKKNSENQFDNEKDR